MADEMGTGQPTQVLIDSSSAIILFKCSVFEQVYDYYNVIMPESVFDELTSYDHPGSREFKNYRLEHRIHVVSGGVIGNAVRLHGCDTGGMGTGERDTILLFYSNFSDMIIIDDRKGAAYCKKNKIPYINALLVPRVLNQAGRISNNDSNIMMKKIIECGRYSKKIIEYAYCCSDETIKRFL